MAAFEQELSCVSILSVLLSFSERMIQVLLKLSIPREYNQPRYHLSNALVIAARTSHTRGFSNFE